MSPSKKTSRELAGTLRNLKKVEQALQTLLTSDNSLSLAEDPSEEAENDNWFYLSKKKSFNVTISYSITLRNDEGNIKSKLFVGAVLWYIVLKPGIRNYPLACLLL